MRFLFPVILFSPVFSGIATGNSPPRETETGAPYRKALANPEGGGLSTTQFHTHVIYQKNTGTKC